MTKNYWSRSEFPREPGVIGKPLVDPANWDPDEILSNRNWIYRLSQTEISEIKEAVGQIEQRGFEIKNITSKDFFLPTLSSGLQEVQDELMEGRGLVLIKGLPVDQMNRWQVATTFWGISSYIGKALSQNHQGHVLGHVKDIGENYGKVRGYMTKARMAFHCDQCDILGLACLHTAKKGGEHLVCSSVALYNEMLKQRPDLVKELAWHFYRQLSTETHPGQKDPWIRQATFNFHKGYFACRSVSAALEKAQALPGVPKFTKKQKEAFRLYHELANELAIEVPMERGDVSYVMNHVTLHSRTKFEDWPENDRKRHLLRIWLNTGDRRPLPPEIWKFSQGIFDETTKFSAPLDV